MSETLKPNIKEIALQRWLILITLGRIGDADRLLAIVNRRNLRCEWIRESNLGPIEIQTTLDPKDRNVI